MGGMAQPLASMTGFGRARGQLSDRLDASLVVRAVNHKFLDVVVRTNLRDELPEVEAAIRAEVATPLQRGRVSVQVNLEWTSPPRLRVMVDGRAASSALQQIAGLDLPDGVSREVAVRDVLAVPGVVSVASGETIVDDDEIEALRAVAREAMAAFLEMRHAEGRRLVEQVTTELGLIEEFVDWFEPQMSSFREQAMQRVRDRIAEALGGDVAPDPDRVIQEAALQADRADVAEEIVRLRSHLKAFRSRMGQGGAVGRALDFLCQEIHRELNTLGSKCREAGVADRLVDAKGSGERVREQVQNLE